MTEQELYIRRLTNDYNDILTKYYRLCEEYRQLEEKYTEQKNFLDKLCEHGIIEVRYNPYHDPANGRFSSGGAGGTKYAPSPRANSGGITLKPKTFVKVRGEFNTRYPNAAEGFVGRVTKGKYNYRCKADGLGSIIILSRYEI